MNKNVVLVLVSSVPFDISWAKKHTKGIMVCASGSMELGNGLADIIFGKESPAGRLNMTWYHSADDLPPITDYDIIQGKRTYQYYEGEVLYSFGYGLTYSRIKYTSLSVQQKEDILHIHNIYSCQLFFKCYVLSGIIFNCKFQRRAV